MYSIIIVDDEEDMRKAVIDIIDWDALGFQLAGEAGNGEEALALIEEKKPDVILTDIKMPFMDGVTLARRVRETNPVTKIVFLTGFSDFEYAISAIKLNVLEYLLKPISAKNLALTLQSIKQKLDEEQQAVRNLELLTEGYNQSFDLRRMSFLISTVTERGGERADEASLMRSVADYRLRLAGERYLLFTIQLDASSFGRASVPTDDVELLKFSVAKTVRSIADKYVESESFIFGASIICILSDSTENLELYADILIREIHQSITLYYGFTATIGVSEPYADFSASPTAFTQSLNAVHYREVLGDGKVIYLRDMEQGRTLVPVFAEPQEQQLGSLLKTGSREEMERFVDGIFAQLRDSRVGLEMYRICAVEIYAVILRALKSVGGQQGLIEQDLAFSADLLRTDISGLRDWLVAAAGRVMDLIRQQRQTSSGALAAEGYEYMRQNFADPDISLKRVSAHLHISASYFSAVFKKETGTTFTDALIKIRMESARELLLSSPMKIFEVAARTGYSDQHYFSYCFKKYFGVSPNEMRASHSAATV